MLKTYRIKLHESQNCLQKIFDGSANVLALRCAGVFYLPQEYFIHASGLSLGVDRSLCHFISYQYFTSTVYGSLLGQRLFFSSQYAFIHVFFPLKKND